MSEKNIWLSRRQALYLMAGAAGGLALHGCSQGGAGPEAGGSPTAATGSPTTATGSALKTVVSPWPGYSGHYVAMEQGFYKENGINVEETFVQSASEGITAFLANKVDVAWLTSGDAIQCAAKDPNVRIFYVVDYSNGSDGIIARGVKTAADLKGKTIGRENILFENVLLRAYLTQGKLTEADVTLKDMTAADAATAFAAKRVDAAVTYEPWMSKAAKDGGGEVVFTSKDTNLIVDILATRVDVIANRKAELEAMIKAIDKAVKLVNAGDEAAIKITAAKLGATIEDAKAQIAGVKIFDIALNKSLGFNKTDPNNMMGNLKLTVEEAVRMKLVTQPMPVESLYDDSIVQALG
jgi:NitT/TauT family transport system substrate-binding protein